MTSPSSHTNATSWKPGQSGNPKGRPKSVCHDLVRFIFEKGYFAPNQTRDAIRLRERLMQNLVAATTTGVLNFDGRTVTVSDKVWLGAVKLMFNILGDVDDDNPPLPTPDLPDRGLDEIRAAYAARTTNPVTLDPTPIPDNPVISADHTPTLDSPSPSLTGLPENVPENVPENASLFGTAEKGLDNEDSFEDEESQLIPDNPVIFNPDHADTTSVSDATDATDASEWSPSRETYTSGMPRTNSSAQTVNERPVALTEYHLATANRFLIRGPGEPALKPHERATFNTNKQRYEDYMRRKYGTLYPSVPDPDLVHTRVLP